MYPSALKAGSWRAICTFMIIAALFTTVRKWKHCLCPLLEDEQTKCSLDVQQNEKGKESEVAQSCPTLCDPMDCSLPGSFVNGIFQARVPEWVAISFSRGSSRPRNWTWVSRIVDRCFTIWATREVQQNKGRLKKEGNSNTSYDTDKPWGHYAKWNEPVTKAQTLNDFPYMRYHSSYSNSH